MGLIKLFGLLRYSVRSVHPSLIGTYDCQCKKDYEGDGFDHCEPNEYCIEGKNNIYTGVTH